MNHKTLEELHDGWRKSQGNAHTEWPAVQQQINQLREPRGVTSDTVCSPWGTPTEDPINPSHYSGEEVYIAIGKVLSRLELQPQSYSDMSNVLKYLLRCGLKGATLEELKKAQWYLNKLVERENGVPTMGDD